MIDLIHCKNLCKCYNVPPPSTTIKKGKKKTNMKKKNLFKKIFKITTGGLGLRVAQVVVLL
jgi:hypothetical protein